MGRTSSSKESSTSTLSHLAAREPAPGVAAQPHLFLVFQSDHPLSFPARYCLRDVEELALGRAAEGTGGEFDKLESGRFKLSLPDRWMSSSHAILRNVAGQWILEDAGSKNGTLVNGRRCERATLADGALIELGHTFFIFRQAVLVAMDAPASLSSAELRPAGPGFATLVPELAKQLGNLEAIAPSSVSVVIQGESGTGKELVAQAIHRLSGR